jgi:lipoprotein-anchoring transpeptidase ErfK/SrfK
VHRRRIIVALCLIAAAAVAVGAKAVQEAGGGRASTGDDSLAASLADVPRPARPAFRVGRPVLLDRNEVRARFAPVTRSVEAVAKPRLDASTVATVTTETPEGTTNIVLVLGEVSRRDGTWVHVRLPVLPNERTGWVPRSALGGYHFVHTRLIVDRGRLTATLVRDGRRVFRAQVGIGRAEWPTPAGEFYIRDKVRGFNDPFYGPVAFGTSARSAVLTDWPGGGFIGIHGTNAPELIPGRVSHGCIRMRNADILRLARLMPVGTPLTIR